MKLVRGTVCYHSAILTGMSPFGYVSEHARCVMEIIYLIPKAGRRPDRWGLAHRVDTPAAVFLRGYHGLHLVSARSGY